MEKLFPCGPCRSMGEQQSTCSLWRRPPPEQVAAQKNVVTQWETDAEAGSWQDCTLWKEPILEQFMKNRSPQEGVMLEKFMENCLPWERPHTGEGERTSVPKEEAMAETTCDELTIISIL
ncbi:hypothetical protein BTVI_17057 [Pitangus sulphuratus]|nr:hypothetical protein BTVI_17057 [Pitangus sulphuratus]